MSRVLVIGCGGVASVAIHKICQVSDVFTDCFYHPDRVYKLRRRRPKRVRIGKKDDL